jgi:hypothetical protein
LYEADLGGGLLKKRIARPGQGKSRPRSQVWRRFIPPWVHRPE